METSCPGRQHHRHCRLGPGPRGKKKAPRPGAARTGLHRKSLEAPSAVAAPARPLLRSAGTQRRLQGSHDLSPVPSPPSPGMHRGCESPGIPDTRRPRDGHGLAPLHSGEMPAVPVGCAELRPRSPSPKGEARLVQDAGTVQLSRVTLTTPRASRPGDPTVLPADFLDRGQPVPVPLPTPQPAWGFLRAREGAEGTSPRADPITAQFARACTDWESATGLTGSQLVMSASSRHTEAVKLA